MPINIDIRPWKDGSNQANYPNSWLFCRSPDIFVDNNGDRVKTTDPTLPAFSYYENVDMIGEPAKGEVNRLFAVVRNLGNSAAKDVQVFFSYSPYGIVGGSWFGSQFRPIADVSVDLEAAGSPDSEKEVEVPWDLSDLTDTNGGLWPAPLSYFDHFCVLVNVQHPNDVNASNNLAQNNFCNVVAHSAFSPLPLLIANSEKKEVEYEFTVQRLPEKWRLRVRGLGQEVQTIAQERSIKAKLKPGEEKFITLTIIPSTEEKVDQPIEVLMLADGRLVGGFAIRAQRGLPNMRMAKKLMQYRAPFALQRSRPVRFPKE